jgi:serine/threonine-protein kinase
MTRTLGRAASYGFSPPEQIMGTGTDSRSDIYSLAATVYFALTGQTPVPAHERVAGKPLPAPNGIAADLPDEVNDMVLRGLNLNINERPQTIKEFLEVFGTAHSTATETLMSGKTVQISDLHFGPVINTQLNRSQPLNGAPATAAKAPQRSAWIILSGAVLTVIAIAAGGIYWALNKDDTAESANEPQTAAVTAPATALPGAQPLAPATMPSAALPAFSAPQPAGPSALDVLNQRRQTSPAEEPQTGKTTNAAEKTLRPATPPKPAVEPKKYTAKPATKPKPKVEARNTPEPAPATKKESSSWVIIPGQTQKKY